MDIINDDSNVLFSINGVRYVVPGDLTSEVIAVPEEITPVPSAPPFIAGISNPFGKVLVIADLRQMLGFEPCGMEPENMLIVLNEPDNIGLLVDKLISDESLSGYYRVGTSPLISELISDFYKNDKNKNVVTELNISEIVTKFELDKVLNESH